MEPGIYGIKPRVQWSLSKWIWKLEYKSKQAKKSFETFKVSKAKKSFWKIIVKESFTFLRCFPEKQNLL